MIGRSSHDLVIVLDIGTPKFDGLEATRQIREAAPKTEILILTMHESNQMVRRVLEAGARGYVLKSDLAGHLLKAVNVVSKGKFYLTPKVSEIVHHKPVRKQRSPFRRTTSGGKSSAA